MALTAYCKKCNREVSPGEVCPRCGTKLPKFATHAAWVVERRPAADWMCWNGVMRWLVPTEMTVLALSLVLEWLSGGPEAVERLFQGSFPLILLGMALASMAVVLLVLGLQGKELVDYVIDSRGVHATRYLPDPTPLKLMARLKSPARMSQINPETELPVLRLEESDLAWKDVARVQLWPEKCYILFYAPAWWLRLPVRATPFSWEDALFFVRDRLGRKKTVELPEHLRTQAAKKPSARRSGTAGTPARVARVEQMEAPPFEENDPRTERGFGWKNAKPEEEKTAISPEPGIAEEEERSAEKVLPETGMPWEKEKGPAEEVPPEAGQQMRMDLDFSEEA